MASTPPDLSEDSSAVTESTIHSDECWSNPLSPRSGRVQSTSTDEDEDESEEKKSEQDEDSTVSVTSSSLLEISSSSAPDGFSVSSFTEATSVKEEEPSPPADATPLQPTPVVREAKDAAQKGRMDQVGSRQSERLDYKRLFSLLDEQVPEQIARTLIDDDSPLSPDLTVKVCEKCNNEVLLPQQIQFEPCKHVYCCVCIITNEIARPSRLLIQCPELRCNSTVKVEDLRQKYPDTFGAAGITPSTQHPKSRSASVALIDLRSSKRARSDDDPIPPLQSEPRSKPSSRIEMSPGSDEVHLLNVLVVSCPQCNEPVQGDAQEYSVTCRCGHKFCFACLQPIKGNSGASHKCQSSFPADEDPPSRIESKRHNSRSCHSCFWAPFRACVPLRSRSTTPQA